MTPWSVLELDPASATERDVKRSYAKKLKVCRPDQDPEGFRELHDAYTRALQEIQWGCVANREEYHQMVDPDPSPPSLEEADPADQTSTTGNESTQALSTPNAPAGFLEMNEAFATLEDALASGHDGVADRVRNTEGLLYQYPELAPFWGEKMHDLITRLGDHEDFRLKPEAVLFELEHGGHAATFAIIDRLDRQANISGLSGLAELLVSNKSRIAGEGTGIAAAHLACALAFWARNASGQVADLAFTNLNRDQREIRMQFIDRNAAMSDLLQLAPTGLKSFWRQQLLGNSPRESWDSPDGQLALRWLQRASLAPQTYQTLFNLVPGELSAGFNRKATMPTARSGMPARSQVEWQSRPQPAIPRSSSNISFRLIWVVAFMLIKAVALLGTCSNSSVNSDSYPRSRPIVLPTKPAPSAVGFSSSPEPEPIHQADFKDLLTKPDSPNIIRPDPAPWSPDPLSR